MRRAAWKARSPGLRAPRRREHEATASVLYNLGFLQLLRGQAVEAEQTFRRVLELYRRDLGERHPAVARTLHSLAIIYGNLGQPAEAERLYRQAIVIYADSFGPDDPSLAATRLELGLLLSDLGRSEEAIAEAQAAIDIYDRIEGPWAIKRAYATSVLGFALHAAGRRDEAAEKFERALAMMKEVRGPDSADLPPGLIELALIRIEQGRYKEAETLARRAVEIREKDEALTPWGVAKAKSVLAQAIARAGPLDGSARAGCAGNANHAGADQHWRSAHHACAERDSQRARSVRASSGDWLSAARER